MQNPEQLEKISIDAKASMLAALKQMDELDRKLLLISNDGQYGGIVSAGDIQRAIIANLPLETSVDRVKRENVRVANTADSFDSVKAMMMEFRTEFMPVLDDAGDLVKIYYWDDIFSERPPARKQLDLPVIIMAGGKGTRLKPFSNILPKPLFPIGEKTIVETIIDRFVDVGCRNFLMSVNYKSDFIASYFEQIEDPDFQIEFFKEPKPLGTAGSLRLIESKVKERFFVSNCDIIIDTDYSEIVDYHEQQQNEITLVAALKHLKIPYGTLETAEGGQLLSIREKPELTHLINAGLYLLEPNLLQEIPENEFFHITQLIESVISRGGRVGVFPVSEKSWHDIGEWHEYDRTLKLFSQGS